MYCPSVCELGVLYGGGRKCGVGHTLFRRYSLDPSAVKQESASICLRYQGDPNVVLTSNEEQRSSVVL